MYILRKDEASYQLGVLDYAPFAIRIQKYTMLSSTMRGPPDQRKPAPSEDIYDIGGKSDEFSGTRALKIRGVQ